MLKPYHSTRKALCRHLFTIDRLIETSQLLNALTDRLIEVENKPELQLARRPCSREGLLGMMRFTQTACAAALVLPLLDELKRRQGAQQNSSPSFTEQRLTTSIRQLEHFGDLAARSIIEALAITRDLRCWTHTAPSMLPRWALSVVDRLETGKAEDLRPFATRQGSEYPSQA